MAVDMEVGSHEEAVSEPAAAPRPRPFPIVGSSPGPRCGHTLTAINTTEESNNEKLILFGNPLPRTYLVIPTDSSIGQ